MACHDVQRISDPRVACFLVSLPERHGCSTRTENSPGV